MICADNIARTVRMIVITYFSGNNNETIKENDKNKINIIKLAVEAFVGPFF